MRASASTAASTVGLRSHLSSLDGFGDAITNVGVRLDLAQSTLGRLGDIAHDVDPSALQSGGSIHSSGQTQPQLTAYSELARSWACSTPGPETAICSPAAPATSRRPRASTAS